MNRLRIPQHKIDELAGRVGERDVLQAVTSDCALCDAPLLKTPRGWLDGNGSNSEYCFPAVLGRLAEQLHIARCDLPETTDRESIEAWLDAE